MIPTPIPAYVIHTVFQYILPPSLPIPPHLVSRQLSERHHFLSISPTDVASYLCWPSHEAPEIVNALEGTPHDAWASEPEHQVYYTAPDEETLLAHVHPTEQSLVQIVFSWDSRTESWRYHDARLLPFPSPSYTSLQEALASMPQTSGTRSSSPDSDNYWAGYGSGNDSPKRFSLTSNAKIEDEDKAEAAYWASYSVVQGSGDSTIPSPKSGKRTLPEYSLETRGPETAFDPFIANLHLRLQRENGLNDKLSPGHSVFERSHSPQPDGQNDIYVDEAISGEECSRDDVFPDVSKLKLLGDKDAWVCSANGCTKGLPEVLPEPESVNELDKGLEESIKGLYRMWTACSGSNDKEAFINIVKDVLG